MCNVVQRIPGNRASLHNGLPSKEKADPVFPGSAAICCRCVLPQELVGATRSGFKSPLPHHSTRPEFPLRPRSRQAESKSYSLQGKLSHPGNIAQRPHRNACPFNLGVVSVQPECSRGAAARACIESSAAHTAMELKAIGRPTRYARFVGTHSCAADQPDPQRLIARNRGRPCAQRTGVRVDSRRATRARPAARGTTSARD